MLEPDPDVLRLPDPVWVCPRPVLNEIEQPKQDEADEALYNRYAALNWTVVQSKQTPLCAIVDCIDNNGFPADAWAEPPPPPTPEEMLLAPGVDLMLTEIEVHTDLQCPPGSTAVDRPSHSAYVFRDTGAASLQDWLDNYPEVVGAPPQAPPVHRLYAGVKTTVENGGANTWINTFNGGELEPETMSLLEMAVTCTHPDPQYSDTLWQQVGIAAVRDAANVDDRGNTGDGALRLQVEFLTAGVATGEGKGGWHGRQSTRDFTPRADSPYPAGATFDPSRTSTVGGPQFESFFQIKLRDGRWWLGHNGNWLGFYRTSLFPKVLDQEVLGTHACDANFYGERSDRRKDKTIPTSTDMSSGQHAANGFGSAAYFRDPVWVDINGITWYWPDAGPVGGPTGVMLYSDMWGQGQYNAACYTFTPLTPPSPHRVMYTDGPGCP
jgi:hypothetical protein